MCWDPLVVLRFFGEYNGLTFLRIVWRICSIEGGDRIAVCPKDACMCERHLEEETVGTSLLKLVEMMRHIQ